MSALPRGTVYGTLLNFRSEWDAWAPRMHAPPYRAPPQAPVLYVKTANTFRPDGADIPVPADVPAVEIGATLGLVIGAGGHVHGCVLANDLAVPHDSYFRPPVRFRCRDGFLGVGLLSQGMDPAGVSIAVRVNGIVVQEVRFDALVRPPAQLVADVAEFMTLDEGDVLLLGCDAPRPLARAGDRIALDGGALGTLTNTLVAAPA
jgi:5-oxopent-3-ene-1,2,5-tricarboxylate decarboxylase/2-hydroxyhepta-2,4-diene-1,7-dioate isomerase